MKIIALLCVLALCSTCGLRAQDAAPVLMKLEFRELPLLDAVRMISEQSGLNITASSEAARTPVSLFLRNVPADVALEELCKSHSLWFKRDERSGIMRVVTTKEFERDLVTFREEKTEVFTLLYPNAVEIAVAIRDLFGDRVELSLGAEEIESPSRDLEERFSRFDIVDQRSQGLGLFGGSGSSVSGSFGGSSIGSSGVIGGAGSNRFSSIGGSRAGLSRNERRREGGVDGETDERRNEFRNLTASQLQAVETIMKDGPEADRSLALAALRARDKNIFVTVSRRNNLLIVRTGDLRAMDEIHKLVKRLDMPTSQVLLEVKVLSIELGDGFNSVFDYQFSDGVHNAGGYTNGDVLPPASDVLSGTARKAASLALGGTALQAGNLTYQFVNDNFRARMQLLETKNKVTTMATPLILTSNNEVSRVFVGEERPIVRNVTTQTIINDNQTTTAPSTTIEFRPVGTTLLITPNINSDRTVTLRLLQENSSINAAGATIPIVTGNGAVTNQPVDVVQTRTVSGTIVGKDGLCVAIGGLIEDALRDSRAHVPVIGKVPGIGFFFRRNQNSRSKRELIVMIRPHIVSTPAEAEEISRKLNLELSIHPKLPDAKGTLETHIKAEVIDVDPPQNQKESILKVIHTKQDKFEK